MSWDWSAQEGKKNSLSHETEFKNLSPSFKINFQTYILNLAYFLAHACNATKAGIDKPNTCTVIGNIK